MNSVTYQGTEYDLVIEGDDICLQSLHQDIIIIGGYSDLLRESEEYCKDNAYDYYGRYVGFSQTMIEDVANRDLEEYALGHASEGEIVLHNLN